MLWEDQVAQVVPFRMSASCRAKNGEPHSGRVGAGGSRKRKHMKGAELGSMPRQSRLSKIQYAAITAMKNDMRSARPAMAAIMVA